MDDAAKLRERITELEEQVRARDDFVAMAAHELRNPMGAFILQVQHLILLAEDDAAFHKFHLKLMALERQLQGFTRRATTLLDVSRLLSGNFLPQRETVNFSAIVREAVSLFLPQCERLGGRFDLDLPGDVSGEWDGSVLELVAHNLLSNAIKYGAGQPIAVALAPHAGGVELCVSDRGIGISSADQQRIFGRFERAVTRRSSGGFGLGLWITQQLVHSLGWRITVQSEPGRGSTFRVTLPTKENP
jgi:signal transduction histidine kinase